MAGGGLFDPLGVDHVERARPPYRPSAPIVVAALCAALIAVLFGVAWIRDDGDRGEPRAVGPITHVQAPAKPVAPPAPPAAAPSGLPQIGADQDVEIQNGVRIIRPRRDRSLPQGQAIQVPGAPARAP